MPSMLQALRERRLVEDAHEVGSEACQVRNQAEAQNSN